MLICLGDTKHRDSSPPGGGAAGLQSAGRKNCQCVWILGVEISQETEQPESQGIRWLVNWLIHLAPGDRMPQLHIVLTWRQQHPQRDFQEGRKAVSGQEKAARGFWIARVVFGLSVGGPVGDRSTWGRKAFISGRYSGCLTPVPGFRKVSVVSTKHPCTEDISGQHLMQNLPLYPHLLISMPANLVKSQILVHPVS